MSPPTTIPQTLQTPLYTPELRNRAAPEMHLTIRKGIISAGKNRSVVNVLVSDNEEEVDLSENDKYL